MRMKTQRILAALLSLVLLLALAPAGWAEGEGGNEMQEEVVAQAAPVLSTITVDLSANNYDGDIYKAKVMADLYLVVPAVKNEAYNSYDLDFKSMNPQLDDLKDDFQKAIYGDKYGTSEYTYDPSYRPNYADFMDETVIPFILDKEKSFTPTDHQGVADETSTSFQFTDVTPGMYILVPHGQDLTDKKDYIKTVTIKATEDVTGGKKQVSMAHSSTHEYFFTPQLIFVPTKDAVEGVIATWNPGEWIPDLTVSLKSEQRPRLGSLKIVKNLSEFIGTKSALFIFQVEATLDGGTVFSDAITLKFNGETNKECTLANKIPVGATVTVQEVYSGAYKQDPAGTVSYTYDGETAEAPIIDASKLLVATLTNVPGENPPGDGIVNHVNYQLDDAGRENLVPSTPYDNSNSGVTQNTDSTETSGETE